MLREHAMYTHHCFVLACCLGAALPAPASDLFAPAELSDQELSQLRGRYVLPGRIVSFGVVPTYPETGYGYITDGGAMDDYAGLHRVAQFVEKPGHDHAQRLIEAGGAFWASGISLMRADTLIEEFRRLDPVTHAAVTAALDRAEFRRLGIVLEEESFRQAANEPTERQVFERTPAISLAPLHGVQWDDVGAWNAVYQIAERDDDGRETVAEHVERGAKHVENSVDAEDDEDRFGGQPEG